MVKFSGYEEYYDVISNTDYQLLWQDCFRDFALDGSETSEVGCG